MKEEIKQYIEQFKNDTQQLDRTDERLKKLDIDFVKKLSRIIEKHPGIRKGQSKYVTEKSLMIANALDMSAEDKVDILYAGLLLQLGKINLPYRLLTKPFYSMSSVDQYRYLGHAVECDEILHGLAQFEGAMALIRHQYERYDGRGFPDGLMEHNIPLGSRIFSVVSDYAAYVDGSMTGKEMFVDAARSQLLIQKEGHYDPEIVEIFFNVLRGATLEELKGSLAKSKLLQVATKRWKKGILIKEAHDKNITRNAPVIMEISLPLLKPGMRVESVYFGSELYIKNCIADQTIIDDISTFQNKIGKIPIVKICVMEK